MRHLRAGELTAVLHQGHHLGIERRVLLHQRLDLRILLVYDLLDTRGLSYLVIRLHWLAAMVRLSLGHSSDLHRGHLLRGHRLRLGLLGRLSGLRALWDILGHLSVIHGGLHLLNWNLRGLGHGSVCDLFRDVLGGLLCHVMSP